MKRSFILLCLIILLSLVFFSCNSKSQKNVRDVRSYPLTTSVEAKQKLALDSVVVSYPAMKIDGDYCCIADYSAHDYFFHIFSFPSFKYIRSIAKKGNASNELALLTDFDFHDCKITALCEDKRQLKVFDIQTTATPQIIRLTDAYSFSSVCDGGDQTYYLYALNDDDRMVRIDITGTVLSKGMPAEKLKKKYPRMTSNYIWQGLVRKHQNVIVIPTICGDIIDICDTTLSSVTRIMGALGEPQIKESSSKGVSSYMLQYQTYVDAVLGENIYALFVCEDLSKYPNGTIKHSIRKYDYSGKPIEELLIDNNVEPSSMYVDEHEKKLYLLVPESETPIWIYDL